MAESFGDWFWRQECKTFPLGHNAGKIVRVGKRLGEYAMSGFLTPQLIGYFSSIILWNNKAQVIVLYKTNYCLLLSCNGKLCLTVGIIYSEKCHIAATVDIYYISIIDIYCISMAATILKYGRYHRIKSTEIWFWRRTTNIHECLRILRSKVTNTRSMRPMW